jgi:hypothetical protein
MKQKDFEARVLEIWLLSRVSLTLAHVQHLTGASRDKTKKTLDAMTVEGVLSADIADDGEMIWSVVGAERPKSGPQTVAELQKMRTLSAEVAGPRALARAAGAVTGAALSARGGDQKSVVASGGLSLVLGPLGWLYAAPLRESIPGVAVYVGVCSFLPHVLLMPLLGLLAPLSGLAGVYYAIRHNQTGERTGLFSDRNKNK